MFTTKFKKPLEYSFSMQWNELIQLSFTWLQANVAEILVNLVIAIIITLIGFSLGNFIGKLLEKILREIEIDKILKIKGGLSFSVIIREIFSLSVYIITIVLAMNQLRITKVAIYFIILVFLITILIAFFLYLRDFLPNLFYGFMLSHKKSMAVGDYIERSDFAGDIEKINLLDILIKTGKNDYLVIPNKTLHSSKLTIRKQEKHK